MNTHYLKYFAISVMLLTTMVTNVLASEQKVKVATFNVSMEAQNYLAKHSKNVKTQANTLEKAIAHQEQQIKNIAEIIQRVNPDVILLNEFDNQNNNNREALKSFLANFLNKSQNGHPAIDFPFYYQSPVNTGVNSLEDLDGNKKAGQLPGDGYGYGHFPGHYSMALLSKYPIQQKDIRTFQLFKWSDMPNALQPLDPKTGKPWFSKEAWQTLRLSSKSHWDVPILVNDSVIHILASHPTPPVFDGSEDRNGKRNHDEIRFWLDYITPEQANYIYDDNGITGGIKQGERFVILGDQNASLYNGNAIPEGIGSLLSSQYVQDPMPTSLGGKQHKPDSTDSKYFTAHWGMRADYVLPSTHGFKVVDSGVFWPKKSNEAYRLIESRSASSDHRLVWVDLLIK